MYWIKINNNFIKYFQNSKHAFLNCSNLECILYYGTNNPNISYNSFSGCEKLSLIITYLTYSSETFGSFKVRKTSELPSQLKEISSRSFEGCNKLKSIIILSNISYIREYAFLNCLNLECILYYGTNNPEKVHDNIFSGCEEFSFIITCLTYSSETFGSFKVLKSSELPLTCHIKSNRLKSGEIASIIICSFIFIVIICVVLFFTVFRKKKDKTQDENTP